MPVRPTWLIGLGALGAQTLTGLAAALEANYGAEALDEMAWLALDVHPKPPQLPKQALYVKLVEPPRAWFGREDGPPQPALADWFQPDRLLNERVRLDRILRSENRQLQRLLFLGPLVDTPEKLLEPLRLDLRQLRARAPQRSQRAWIFGSLAEPALSAWYLDLANLLHAVATDEGATLSLSLFAALPQASHSPASVSEAHQSTLAATTYAFLRELTRYSRPAGDTLAPLYPASSAGLTRYNAQRVLVDDVYLMDGQAVSDPSIEAAASAWVAATLPLLDENLGRAYIEERENRQANQPRLRSDVPLLLSQLSAQTVQVDYQAVVTRWSERLVRDFLLSKRPQAVVDGLPLARGFLAEGLRYPALNEGGEVAAPQTLWRLHDWQRRTGESFQARRDLDNLDLTQLLAWLDADDSLPQLPRQWSPEAYEEATPAQLLDQVKALLAAVGAPETDASNPVVLAQIRKQGQALAQQYQRALRGFALHGLREGSLEDALAALNALLSWLQPLPAFCEKQISDPSEDTPLAALEVAVRREATLVERAGLVRRVWRFQDPVSAYLDAAQQVAVAALRRALWQQYALISRSALSSTEGMAQTLQAQKDLLSASQQHLPPSAAIDTHLLAQPAALEALFTTRTRRVPQQLEDAWRWLWTIEANGAAQLHLHIAGQRVTNGAQVVAALSQVAHAQVSAATADITLWDLWDGDDPARREIVARQLSSVGDALDYAPSRSQTRLQPTRRHWLAVSRSKRPTAAYEEARAALLAATTAELTQSIAAHETGARHYLTVLRLDDGLLADMLAQYSLSRDAYESLRPERRMALHITAGEVEAVRLEGLQRAAELSPRRYGTLLRTLLAQPAALRRLMHLLAYDMIPLSVSDDSVQADAQTGQIPLRGVAQVRDWLGGPRSLVELSLIVAGLHPTVAAPALADATIEAMRDKLAAALVDVYLTDDRDEMLRYLTDSTTWRLLRDIESLASPQIEHWRTVAAYAQLLSDTDLFFRARAARADDRDHDDLWHALAAYAYNERAMHQRALQRALVAGG